MGHKINLDSKRLTKLQHQIWEIATAHGWHEHPLSMEHYCGLIMTEIAEAVEADRNNRRADTEAMKDLMEMQAASKEGLSVRWYDMWFEVYYKDYIKGSIEEEFADIVIRILDMAQERHGEKMKWLGCYPCGGAYNENKSFVENAWYFIHDFLNYGTMNISDCVSFMYDWAHHLDINLDMHIEWKIKYNELRPYKHGGKKY